MYNSSGNPTIRNCAFNGNLAANGGGVYNSTFSSPTLVNCTFSGNVASAYGGGLYNLSYPTVANCTFIGNLATTNGNAVYNSSSNPTMANCIIWGSGTTPIYNSSSTPVITYSDIQGGYTGTGNINADPVFVHNPSAGSDGKWGTADDDYGNLQLQCTSPCIDAGKNSAVPGGITTDIAGAPRFADLPGVPDTGLGTAPIVDMGAYELAPLTVTLAGTAGNDNYYANLSTDHSTLQLWTTASPAGNPAYTYAMRTLGSCGVLGNGGNNTLTLDVSNGVPPVGLTVTAGDGSDTLILTGFSATNTVDIRPTQVLVNSAVVTTSSVETILLDAPAGGTLGLASLTLSQPAALVAGKNLALRAGSLSITGAGSLDLAGNSMILDYSSLPMAQVQQWINTGRMGLTPALKTTATVAGGTATLGMADNAMIHLASFAGQSLGGVFNQLLIQPTVAGDANLDGQVTQADYLNILANMGRTGASYFEGDLDGDGIVTPDDIAIVSANLGAGVSLAAGPALAAATPAAAKTSAAAAGAMVVKQVVKKAAVRRPASKPQPKATRPRASVKAGAPA
jgi:hypothetical protein